MAQESEPVPEVAPVKYKRFWKLHKTHLKSSERAPNTHVVTTQLPESGQDFCVGCAQYVNDLNSACRELFLPLLLLELLLEQ